MHGYKFNQQILMNVRILIVVSNFALTMMGHSLANVK